MKVTSVGGQLEGRPRCHKKGEQNSRRFVVMIIKTQGASPGEHNACRGSHYLP